MLFSLKRILHSVRRRAGIYLIFLLEFAIGAAILSSSLNVVFSLQEDLKKAKARMEDEIIEIQAHGTQWTDPMTEIWVTPWEQTISVGYDTYLKLNKLYGNELDILYTLETSQFNGIFYENADNKVESFSTSVYFVNDAQFRELFGVSMEEGRIYAGEKAYKDLEKLIEYGRDSKYIYAEEVYDRFPKLISSEDGKLFLSRENEYELVRNPDTDKVYFVEDEGYEDSTKLSDIVFIPIKEFRVYRDLLRREFYPYGNYYENIKVTKEDDTTVIYRKLHRPPPVFSSSLRVKLKNENADVNLIPSLLTFLNSGTRDLEFTLSQELLEVQSIADSIDQSIILRLIISASVMLIVVLGTTGLFLIFLYQRKKQMAVSIAYGSTRSRLFGEIFAEVMIITGLGTAAGIYALKFTMAYAVKLYSAATMHLASIIIPIAAAAVCSLITAALAFTGAGEIAPAKILKDL